jgi:hypothetical protein
MKVPTFILRPRFLGLLLLPALASAATYVVNSIPALQTQIGTAVAGDTIILNNGTYTTSAAIVVNRAGAPGNPITIAAETIGGVTIDGTHGFTFSSPAAYVAVEGFRFLHAAAINIPSSTHHIALRRNFIDLNIAPGADVSYVNIGGDDVEIGYNELANKNTLGNMLDVTGSGSQVARRLWVHHNYFHDFVSPGGNGAETIRWGLSGLSLSNGQGLCEYNLFVHANGENEMISNKSSGNTYRFNTVLDSPGGEISQRHGDNCLYYGNYMKNTAGIRVYGDSHQIFSNYLEGNSIGINMGNGDGDVHAGDPLTAHDRPDNNVVTFNTLINNNSQYQMGGRTNGLGATNTTFANNIILGGTTAVSISGTAPYTNPVWSGNIIWNATNNGNIPAGGYSNINPLLTPDASGVYHLQSGSPAIGAAIGSYPAVVFDLDGQPRPDSDMDVGADEFSAATITARMLTVSDVGPFASLSGPVPALAPSFSPAPGTYTGSVAVTLSTLSTGAAIRYTTDGSTPTETTGTVYSAPVSIAANTTLKALAYGGNFTPSPVTTGAYLIVAAPPPPPPIPFEAESLDHTEANGGYSISFEDAASGGAFASPNISDPANPLYPLRRRYVTFGGDGVPPPPNGEWIEFKLPAVPAGTYNLVFRYKSHPTNRAIMSLSVDGIQLGSTLDQRTSATFPSRDFGVVRFATTGDHYVRLHITGKSNATGPWNITADVITLVPDNVPPVISPLPDLTVEATGPAGVAVTYTGTATDDKDGSVPVLFDPPSGSVFPLGTSMVVALARDLTGNYGGAAFDVNVVDTTPPVLSLPAAIIAEATGPQGAAVFFSGSASDLVAGEVGVSFDHSPGSVFPLGSTTVAATAADDFENTATGMFSVTVLDTTSPDIQAVTPSLTELWPANHKMVPITLTAVVHDAADPAPATRIVAVTSNESTNGSGDGNTSGDWEITGPMTLKLRAERAGSGSGRIYTITVESTDAAGNVSRTTVNVTVPHHR